MKVILTGGGTLGSVSPLIGIWQKLKIQDKNLETIFIGTKHGPEKEFVRKYNILFKSIAATRFRRYFSLFNLLIPFLILISFIQSLIILLKYKPDWIISAGGYVQVPLIWASKFFKTKVVLYQSDLKVGLANKLNTSQADLIFTTFSESKEYFKDKSKVQVVGTVLRDEINNVASEIDNSILVLGGGTGASSINSLIKDSLDELTINYKVIQVTGKGKQIDMKHDNYEQHEILLDDYYEKISKAKLVISRAGLSSIMELAYLSKNTILIPLPNSPQESNAEYICERNGAICLNQEGLTKDRFLKEVKKEINLGSNFNEIFKLHGEEIIAKIIYGFK